MPEQSTRLNKKWYADGDPWVLTQTAWDPAQAVYFETIFTQSNGYMGIRGYPEECDAAQATCREGYLAGVFATLPPEARKLVIHDYPWDSRQMVSLPQLFSAEITLSGEPFNLADGRVDDFRQTLDMRTGILERQVLWTSRTGKTTRLCFKRFLSAKRVNLIVHKIDLEPINWSGRAEILWAYDMAEKTLFRCGDPALPHLPCSLCTVVETSAEGNRAGGRVETRGTGHSISYASRVCGENVQSRVSKTGLLSQTATASVAPGRVSSWLRTTGVETSRDDKPAPDVPAGYDALLAEHQAVWASRWKNSDIEIEGSVRDQVLVRFGIFSLLQVAPGHSDSLSVPARCYAYNRYNGLYFWDGEIFLLPFYQFCMPEVGRNMLNFRCRTLPGAKRNAALLGGKGAIFPWQGDADFGEEQAPWGLSEYLWHQNADIIYAFDQYARATGDDGFMLNEGLEVLSETARFWVSKLNREADGLYHLAATVGPDEAEEHGPDNGYTSLMARRSLEISHRWWMRAGEHSGLSLGIGADEIAEWKTIAGKINVPEVPGHPGVPLQDAFFLGRKPEDISQMTVAEYWKRRGEVQVIKQADVVLAMYLLEDSFTREEIKCGYEFYEPKTLHVSSLSCNTHAIVAAVIGLDAEAYEYFQRAAGLDLDNLRGATKDGLHAAALGAVWQMVVPGFMGMRVREDHISFQPSLPRAWSRIRFPIQYRGWRITFTARSESYRVEVSGDGQPGAIMRIDNISHTLSSGQVIERGDGGAADSMEKTECRESKRYSLT